ncbi:hypothetical protein BGV47_07270 [Burkholderia ubonensis]|nr:hypothetical protein BGV47_07270 [Burkholderia ubonensis]
MDVVDWAYQKVGPVEIIWMFLGLFPLWLFGALGWSMFVTNPPRSDEYDQIAYTILTMIIVGVSGIGGFIWFGRILYNTFTGCTHYPVRLDRKNQMVHVFRHNGEDGVSSYRWRDITFGMIGGGALQRSFVKGVMAGYVRRPDGSYDYFRLGGVSSYRWRDITFGMIGGGALQRDFVQGVMAGYVRRPDGSYDYFRLVLTAATTTSGWA